MIKDYLDVGVKNDEQLIKLAAIVQRLASTQIDPEGGGMGLSEEERKALMAEADKITQEMTTSLEVKKPTKVEN